MNRDRAGGVALTVGGVGLFAALFLRGSIRHPGAAAETTGVPEFGAIAAALVLITVGCLLVLLSYVPEHRRTG